MKAALVSYVGFLDAGEFACVDCGTAVYYTRNAPLGSEVPVACPFCRTENAFRRIDGERAALRRSYGCGDFRLVDSSNLDAVGRYRRGTILVRFKRGSIYAYAVDDAREVLDGLLAAESAGRYFSRVLRPLPARLLCATYGCLGSAERERNQVLCARHLAREI